MLERKFVDPDEEVSNGGNVCLPCFDRYYTSDCSHLTVLAFLVVTGATFISSVSLISVSQFIANQSALNHGLWLGGTSLVSAVGTGISFFCGTKSKESSEVEENSGLVQQIRTNGSIAKL